MNVPVMNIRVMKVTVFHGEVRVRVTVLFAFVSTKLMRVLMVLIMTVFVSMFQDFM